MLLDSRGLHLPPFQRMRFLICSAQKAIGKNCSIPAPHGRSAHGGSASQAPVPWRGHWGVDTLAVRPRQDTSFFSPRTMCVRPPLTLCPAERHSLSLAGSGGPKSWPGKEPKAKVRPPPPVPVKAQEREHAWSGLFLLGHWPDKDPAWHKSSCRSV